MIKVFKVEEVSLIYCKYKVCHEDLNLKLKDSKISSNLLYDSTDFVKDRKQRVVLNGKYFSRVNGKAGVPQGSILGSLLF